MHFAVGSVNEDEADCCAKDESALSVLYIHLFDGGPSCDDLGVLDGKKDSETNDRTCTDKPKKCLEKIEEYGRVQSSMIDDQRTSICQFVPFSPSHCHFLIVPP